MNEEQKRKRKKKYVTVLINKETHAALKAIGKLNRMAIIDLLDILVEAWNLLDQDQQIAIIRKEAS